MILRWHDHDVDLVRLAGWRGRLLLWLLQRWLTRWLVRGQLPIMEDSPAQPTVEIDPIAYRRYAAVPAPDAPPAEPESTSLDRLSAANANPRAGRYAYKSSRRFASPEGDFDKLSESDPTPVMKKPKR